MVARQRRDADPNGRPLVEILRRIDGLRPKPPPVAA
jgi:hypothetical protein